MLAMRGEPHWSFKSERDRFALVEITSHRPCEVIHATPAVGTPFPKETKLTAGCCSGILHTSKRGWWGGETAPRSRGRGQDLATGAKIVDANVKRVHNGISIIHAVYHSMPSAQWANQLVDSFVDKYQT